MEYRVNLNLLVYNEHRTNHLRGSMEVKLPFVPSVGMRVQYKDMLPLQFKSVKWLTDKECFDCTVEEDRTSYEFGLDDDIDELIDMYDILRDAKKYKWTGFDKIYRDDW